MARLLACAALGLAAAAHAQTKIRFGNVMGIAYPTLIVAQEKGFFKKENLEVEQVTVAGSGAVAEALASNNIEMGNTPPTTAVLATARGAKIKLLSGFEYTFTDKSGRQWESTFIAVRGGEGIKTLKDLRGKRVAVNDLGSTYNYMLRDQFKRLGIDVRKDVTIVPIPFGQMAGALIQKQVDAVVAISDAVYQARQRIPVEIIGTHTSLEGTDISLTSAIGASNDFLKKDPDAVVRFLRAMLQARQWMDKAAAANDPELSELIARSMKYSPDRAKVFYETRGGYYGKDLAFVNELDIPERLIKRQVEILKSAELLNADKQYDYAEFVDIGHLHKAYESLGMKWDASKH
jgi:NitT/TauT family transport system substrate-binding protein